MISCARPRGAERPSFGPVTDAPWELEDESDWHEVADQLHGLPPGDARRRDLRVQLADAQADRIGRWLDANRPSLAHEELLRLARLFGDDPDAIGPELRGQRATIERARAVFARAGATEEVVLTLVVLGEIEPGERDARWAEIDEVLAYADDLAVAENGAAAIRGRPIAILEPIALALPLPRVTDRYVELVVARQAAVSDALAQDGASFELVRAHGAVLKAARGLAAALARAGRAPEIAARIAPFQGIGADEELAGKARAAAAEGAGPREWIALSRAFRSKDDEDDDPLTARAIALAGLARHEGDATLLAAAASASVGLGRVHEPIRLYEELRRRGAGDARVAEQLADLYHERLAALAFNDRPNDAAARLAELEAYLREAERAFPGRDWAPRRAEALATVGRGLVSQGELDEAIALLDRSVKLDPDAEAYEMLATIALKRGRFGEARAFADRGAALGDDSPAGEYVRAKLLQLAGDGAAGVGDAATAQDRWIKALNVWAELGDAGQLPPALAGERLVRAGQLLWSLGQRDDALRFLESAVDTDADGADTHTQVVAFFLQHGEPARALDAFHRAVIADRIGDYHKVYMSLWLLADARRRGVEPDPLVLEFLEGRDGVLWHDEMARLATGRRAVGDLERRATTRARKAELAYYRAVLGLGGAAPADTRALLEHVVATDMVLFFEYDMARQHLATLD